MHACQCYFKLKKEIGKSVLFAHYMALEYVTYALLVLTCSFCFVPACINTEAEFDNRLLPIN